MLDDKNVRRRFRASNYQVARRAGSPGGITHSCSHPGLCSALNRSRRGRPKQQAVVLLCDAPPSLSAFMHAAIEPSATIHGPACLPAVAPACRARHASSHSSAPCRCAWMRAGTRSSSTLQTSHAGPTVSSSAAAAATRDQLPKPDAGNSGRACRAPLCLPCADIRLVYPRRCCVIILQAPTTWRRCVCRCTPTAASAASTSATGCTVRRSCPQSECVFSPAGVAGMGSLHMPHLKQQAEPAQTWVTSVLSWVPLLCAAGSSCSSPCRRPETQAASYTHSHHTSAASNAGGGRAM